VLRKQIVEMAEESGTPIELPVVVEPSEEEEEAPEEAVVLTPSQ